MVSRRTVICAAAAVLAAAPLAPARAAPILLQRGINAWPWFSLTREFPPPRTGYAWPPFQSGRPVPRAADLSRLRQAGFDFIRLPVDPGPFLAFDGARREILLGTLDAAVDMALDAGLAVVVNVQANAATHFWTPARFYASTDAPAFPAYRDLVAALAQRLASRDRTRLALEPVNEPPQACGAAAWGLVQDELFAAVRRAAPGLTYVASGACGGMVPGLQTLDPRRRLDKGPVLFTFHFYEPYLFTHQGAPWMREPVYRALNAVPWPASEGTLAKTLAAVRRRMAADTETGEDEKASAYRETERVLGVYFAADPAKPFVEHAFAAVDAWRKSNGLASGAVLLGEFGALRTDSRYLAAGAADRARYVRDVREAAEAFGFPWAFWNLFDGFGLMDEGSRRLDPALLAALGLASR